MIIKKQKNKGFVLLFAIVLSTIVLTMALGVSGISLKELNFTTSAKSTNDAFFAADVGADCALFYDKTGVNRFALVDPTGSISCNGNSIPVGVSGSAPIVTYNFVVMNLGDSGNGCASVKVRKDFTDINNIHAKITSDGYNLADSSCNPNSQSINRQLEVNY